MSILSNFEDHVANLFEGVAGKLFRSPVEPVQIARAAEREMAKNKLVGPGRTYAPTLYTVLLAPQDDDNLRGFYPTLSAEFGTYLSGKARETGLHLAATPLVRFMVDEELSGGKFAVFAENVSEAELADLRAAESAKWSAAPAPPASPAPSRPAYAPAQPVIVPVRENAPAPSRASDDRPRGQRVLIDLMTEVRIPLCGERLTVGRDETCDITVNDINVSRTHAYLVAEGNGWAIEDRGSTNGTFVNDERISYLRLIHGDIITVGVSRFEYRED